MLLGVLATLHRSKTVTSFQRSEKLFPTLSSNPACFSHLNIRTQSSLKDNLSFQHLSADSRPLTWTDPPLPSSHPESRIIFKAPLVVSAPCVLWFHNLWLAPAFHLNRHITPHLVKLPPFPARRGDSAFFSVFENRITLERSAQRFSARCFDFTTSYLHQRSTSNHHTAPGFCQITVISSQTSPTPPVCLVSFSEENHLQSSKTCISAF